jgi:Ca2+-binding EF-hand superfamily protein
MTKSFVKIAAVVSLGLLGSLSFTCQAADSTINAEIAARFAKYDVNHDGKLTQEEAKGCMPRIYDHFAYLDSGNKGYLTVAQIQAAAR